MMKRYEDRSQRATHAIRDAIIPRVGRERLYCRAGAAQRAPLEKARERDAREPQRHAMPQQSREPITYRAHI